MPPPPFVPATKRARKTLFRSTGLNEESNTPAPMPAPVDPIPSTSESLRSELLSIQTSSVIESVEKLPSVGVNLGLPAAKNSFESWVVTNMGILKARVKQLQEGVDLLVQNLDTPTSRDTVKTSLDFLDDLMPLSSKDNFDNLEMLLKDADRRRALVGKLAQRGGSSAGDCARRAMASLFSDQFAQEFSWLGSRGEKLAFASSEFKTVIFDAVRCNKPFATTKDQDIEKAVKDWLKNSKKRFASRNKKDFQSYGEHDGGSNDSERDIDVNSD